MTQDINNNRQESVTRSLRITEDRAREYDKVKELFSNANEFADWVVKAHRLHESRQTSDLFAQDTKAIMDMFESIFGVIGGVVSRAEGMVQSKDAEIVEELRSKDDIAEELREEIKSLQDIISEKDAEIKTHKDTIKEVNNQLRAKETELKELQDQFADTKELNDMLKAEKVKYQATEDNNKQLLEEVSTLKETLSEAEKQANESMQKIVALENEKQTFEQSYIEKITSLKEKHRQALDHAEALKSVAIKEAKADAKEETQTKIEAHMDKENELRDKIDNMQETINTYAVLDAAKDREIASLKEELEKVKSATEKKTTKKKPKSKEDIVPPNPNNITIEDIENK